MVNSEKCCWKLFRKALTQGGATQPFNPLIALCVPCFQTLIPRCCPGPHGDVCRTAIIIRAQGLHLGYLCRHMDVWDVSFQDLKINFVVESWSLRLVSIIFVPAQVISFPERWRPGAQLGSLRFDSRATGPGPHGETRGFDNDLRVWELASLCKSCHGISILEAVHAWYKLSKLPKNLLETDDSKRVYLSRFIQNALADGKRKDK